MKFYLVECLVIGLISGGSLMGNCVAEVVQSDNGGEYYRDDYGGCYGRFGYEDKKCYPTYETKNNDACIDYFEKVYCTTREEKLGDVQMSKCI